MRDLLLEVSAYGEPAEESRHHFLRSLFDQAAHFDRDPGTIDTPLGLGIPDWVLFGVALPWSICLLLSFYYCCFFFADDDLTPSPDNPTEDDV